MQRTNLLFATPFLFFSSLLACGGTTETTSELPVAPASTSPSPGVAPSDPTAPSTPSANTCDGATLVVDVARWQRAGSNPKGYEMSTDASRTYCEKPGAHVRSLAGATSDKFGTYMDSISAVAYRGKRVRLRGVVETSNVTGWTGLWLRVDDANNELLAFDNMSKRALEGTQRPSEQFVVLDVANDATVLAFGVLLSGGGEVWTEQVVIEVVGSDVPTTGS